MGEMISKPVLTVALSLVFGIFPAASPLASRTSGQSSIRVTSDLVDLPISVIDRKGNFVAGLHKEDFQILEDGQPQEIAVFNDHDLPVTVGLVVDHSGSMRSKLPEIAAATAEFAESSNPEDQLFVVNFNEIVSMMLPTAVSFTNDEHALKTAVAGSRAEGETALYDAVIDAIGHLQLSRQERQALIIITDGGDNASRHTFREMLDAVKKSGAQIYCITLYDPGDRNAKPGLLRQIAKESGGEAYFPSSVAEVTNLMRAVARDLRQEYILGFIPKQRSAGQSWRPLRVLVSGVDKKKVSVRTRLGYVF